MTKGCYDIRLWGDGITAKCFGTNACYKAECEGASSKIVQCKGTNACYATCMYVHMNVHVHVYMYMYMLYECMYVMYVM